MMRSENEEGVRRKESEVRVRRDREKGRAEVIIRPKGEIFIVNYFIMAVFGIESLILGAKRVIMRDMVKEVVLNIISVNTKEAKALIEVFIIATITSDKFAITIDTKEVVFINEDKTVEVVFVFIARDAPITSEKVINRKSMRGEKVDILEEIISVEFSNNVERSIREGDIICFGETPRGDIHNLKYFDTRVIKAMGGKKGV
jgi:hypothetical protein